MGATVVSTSSVLGVVHFADHWYWDFAYSASWLKLFLALVTLIYFMLTDRKIAPKESWALLVVHVIFISIEIFLKNY